MTSVWKACQDWKTVLGCFPQVTIPNSYNPNYQVRKQSINVSPSTFMSTPKAENDTVPEYKALSQAKVFT